MSFDIQLFSCSLSESSFVWEMGSLSLIWWACCVFLMLQIQGRRDGIPDIDYVENLVYSPILSTPCIRLLTSEGEVGCGSVEEGSVGKLRFINSSSDLDEVMIEDSSHYPLLCGYNCGERRGC